MAIRHNVHANIVALDGTIEPCPVVTFQFHGRSTGTPLVVSLTLCEWQQVARQIAEAASALGN